MTLEERGGMPRFPNLVEDGTCFIEDLFMFPWNTNIQQSTLWENYSRDFMLT